MKKFTFILGFILLFFVQDMMALPTGRRTDVTVLTATEKSNLAAAMLAYIDLAIINEHACNTEFGGGGPGSIHGPELFLNWHRNYIWEMETDPGMAAAIAAIPALNGLLPRWTHSFGTGTMAAFLAVDPDCSSACGGFASCASPPGTGGNPYPYPNPLACNTWAQFTVFSENLRTGYHNNGHGVLGGVMGNFRSPSSPIFWLWHCMIDDVYWDFQNQCAVDGDIHIKDTPADDASEPNNISTVFYLSQDIWVRQNQDTPTGGTVIPHGSTSYTNEGVHENPEYKISGFNYVYIRVRNESPDEFAGGRMRAYWSKASTGLSWPTTWIDYYAGTTVLHGDEIEPANGAGIVPADANIILPPIPPGGQFIVEFPWVVPNPADFSTDIHHFCLLARMVSPFDDMTFPETNVLWQNVKNNNNIAWKNVSIYDVDPNNFVGGDTSLEEIAEKLKYVGVYVTNYTRDDQKCTLRFKARGNDKGLNFFDIKGVVYARMEKELAKLWDDGGLQRTNIEILGEYGGKYYIRILEPRAQMTGILLESKKSLDLEMAYALTTTVAGGQMFTHDVCQFSSDRIVGGEQYQLRIPDPHTRSGEVEGLEITQLTIAPNPARDQFTVAYQLSTEGEVSMTLFDISGRIVQKMARQNNNAGYQSREVDATGLSKGIYILRVQAGQNILNQKVVIE